MFILIYTLTQALCEINCAWNSKEGLHQNITTLDTSHKGIKVLSLFNNITSVKKEVYMLLYPKLYQNCYVRKATLLSVHADN